MLFLIHFQHLSLGGGQSSSCSAVSHIPLPTTVLEGRSKFILRCSQSQDIGNSCPCGKFKVHPTVQSIIWHYQWLSLSKVHLAVQSITWHYQRLSLREGQSSSCSAVNHMALLTAVLEGRSKFILRCSQSHGTTNGCT